MKWAMICSQLNTHSFSVLSSLKQDGYSEYRIPPAIYASNTDKNQTKAQSHFTPCPVQRADTNQWTGILNLWNWNWDQTLSLLTTWPHEQHLCFLNTYSTQQPIYTLTILKVPLLSTDHMSASYQMHLQHGGWNLKGTHHLQYTTWTQEIKHAVNHCPALCTQGQGQGLDVGCPDSWGRVKCLG